MVDLPLHSDSTEGDHPNHCYLPAELPALTTFLHDAIEALRDKMERYQVLGDLVREMAKRNPGVVPWDRVSSEEIRALVELRKCLDWDLDAVRELRRSVEALPETRLVQSLRDKVVGRGGEQEADREVEQEVEQEVAQDVGGEFEQDWKRTLRRVEEEVGEEVEDEGNEEGGQGGEDKDDEGPDDGKGSGHGEDSID
ncbi:hypothetical protein SLS55_009805 [Diplodia seriata]|uniref:Uncharacterized protein n=1 Tax=Diplodia seriata TaxID=420778 RepID=A0ABR3C129_9PEZI